MRQQVVGLKLVADNDMAQKALQAAVTSLVNLVRAHDEVKAAKALEPVVAALSSFYDSEKAAYDSVGADYYNQAGANAAVLIQQGQVSVASQYRSSLEPFGLDTDISLPELKTAGRADLQAEVDSRLPKLMQANTDAANALGDALHRMQARIDTVAKGGALRVRMPPVSLEGVKAWIADFQTLAGVSL